MTIPRIPCEGSKSSARKVWLNSAICLVCGVIVTCDDDGLISTHDRNDIDAILLATGRKPPGQPKIRVLRMLEYIYDDAETMTADIARWQIGATNVVHHGKMTVRSSTFLPEMESEL